MELIGTRTPFSSLSLFGVDRRLLRSKHPGRRGCVRVWVAPLTAVRYRIGNGALVRAVATVS